MRFLLLFLLLPMLSFGQCVLDDNVTAAPLPAGGTYQPGQTITFTYTINAYQGLSVNWLHGIVPTLGPGWNAATLIAAGLPTNATGTGIWLWSTNVTSSATGNIVAGPGWFYDTPSGGPALDGDPGNNWGDGLTGPWTFQWEVTVGDCPPNINGDDLSIVIENYADGETGSWVNLDCQGDPNETFVATIECCVPVITQPILHN